MVLERVKEKISKLSKIGKVWPLLTFGGLTCDLTYEITEIIS